MAHPVQHNYARRLGDLLRHTARRVPAKEGVVFESQRLSWRDIDAAVDALATQLIWLGVEPGDRVAVMCTIRPEHVVATVAAMRIGAVAVGCNVLLTPHEVTKLVNLTEPKVMIVMSMDRARPVAEPVIKAIEKLGKPPTIVIIGGCSRPGHSFEDLVARASDGAILQRREAAISEDDAAMMLLTSGSTGEPKAAVLTHRNIIDNIVVQCRQFAMTESDRILVQLPLSHAGGVTELLVPGLLLGATLVLLERFNPRHALDLIAAEHVTALHQVPSMYSMMFQLEDFERYDLSSLRAIFVAGAATPPLVMDRMLGMAPVITGYGMTESAGFVTYTSSKDGSDTIARTVGRVAPEFDLRIVDVHRRPVDLGTVGEVAIRGSCMTSGYFRNQAATEESIDDEGWFYTGDLGHLDERQYLTLIDRRKLMYITGGYNVYPREVEDYLSALSGVALVAVIGIEDEVFGEVGLAVIQPSPGISISAESLMEFCRGGLAEYKIPRRFQFVSEMPLTSLGKIDRQQLIRCHA